MGGATWSRLSRLRVACLVAVGTLAAVAPRDVRAAGDGLVVALKARPRLMAAIYKVYADRERFPDRAVAAAFVQNGGAAAVDDLEVRFRCERYAPWTPWTAVGPVPPGGRAVVPYHPVLDASIAALTESTPVDVRVAWRRTGDAASAGEASATATFLGAREFAFNDLSDPQGFEERFANAPLLAAWVSRDDPVVKQFAALVSRRAGGAAAVQGIEPGLETVRAAYELMLLNDFVYKSSVGVTDTRLSFDVKRVQNLKFPRDVLRDKSGTCIELAIFLAAVGHHLGIETSLALVQGHCFPIFTLREGSKVRRVPVEATGIRGGLRGGGMVRVGFEKAVDIAARTEVESREDRRYLEVDVRAEWGRGVAGPELPPLPDDALARWGVTEHGVPGVTLPELGAGPAKSDPSGFGGTWEGSAKARFGGADWKPCRMTLAVTTLRDGKFRLSATFVPDDGSATVQEDATAEDQDGQLVFQGTRRVARSPGGATTDLSPGRGSAKVKDGRLVGKYGADGEGFAAFSLARVEGK